MAAMSQYKADPNYDKGKRCLLHADSVYFYNVGKNGKF